MSERKRRKKKTLGRRSCANGQERVGIFVKERAGRKQSAENGKNERGAKGKRQARSHYKRKRRGASGEGRLVSAWVRLHTAI